MKGLSAARAAMLSSARKMRRYVLLLAAIVSVVLTVLTTERGGETSGDRGPIAGRQPVDFGSRADGATKGEGDERVQGAGDLPAVLVVRVVDPDGSPLSATVADVRADEAGQAELTVEAGVQQVVDIRLDGYGPARIRESLAAGERRERVVRLYRGGTVNVKLSSSSTGQPVAGVELSLGCESWTTDSLDPRFSVTDANGIATWSEVPPGLVAIHGAELPSPFVFELRDDDDDLLFAIDVGEVSSTARGGEQSGHSVTSTFSRPNAGEPRASQPAAESLFGRCMPPQPLEVWIDGREDSRADTTINGRFNFRERLDPALPYDLHFRRPGPFQIGHVLTGARVGTEAVLRFPPCGDVALRCLDPHGRSVCRALASIGVGEKVSEAAMLESADGVLRICGLEPGHHEIWLARRGYELLGPLPVEVVPGETAYVSTQFQRQLPVVRVRVKNTAGRPVSNIAVRLRDEYGRLVPGFGEHPDCRAIGRYFPDETRSDGVCFIQVPQAGQYVLVLTITLGGLVSRPFARRQIRVPSPGVWKQEFVLRWQLEVTHVEVDSTVYRAGLRKGDVVRVWNGRVPVELDDIEFGGHSVSIVVSRRGHERTITATPRSGTFGVNWVPVQDTG